MDDLGLRPAGDLARVEDAQARVVDVITRTVDDRRVGAPSALPGWTVGHVLTHLARNADSHRRRAEGAARGRIVEQYKGGFEGRAADIEAGSNRSARELVDDVRESADLLMATWLDLPAEAWAGTTRDVSGRQRPLHALPGRRWLELEIHVVDLDVGPTHRDWPAEFVSTWLPLVRADVADRLPPHVEVPTQESFADDRDELAWLFGRIARPDLPDLAPWG